MICVQCSYQRTLAQKEREFFYKRLRLLQSRWSSVIKLHPMLSRWQYTYIELCEIFLHNSYHHTPYRMNTRKEQHNGDSHKERGTQRKGITMKEQHNKENNTSEKVARRVNNTTQKKLNKGAAQPRSNKTRE